MKPPVGFIGDVPNIVEKQRFAIPKRLRDVMGFPENRVMYLAPGTDGSLALYPESQL